MLQDLPARLYAVYEVGTADVKRLIQCYHDLLQQKELPQGQEQGALKLIEEYLDRNLSIACEVYIDKNRKEGEMIYATEFQDECEGSIEATRKGLTREFYNTVAVGIEPLEQYLNARIAEQNSSK